MFVLDDGAIVYSSSDLANASACEFSVLRALDAKLGRVEPPQPPADAMLERAARLGDVHEHRVLAEYRERFGPWDPHAGTGVVEIERPGRSLGQTRAALEAKHDETTAALRTGADVVFQAGFFDGRFGGWADFLVRERTREAAGAAPVYAVYDTKLARHAKITALLQLAAYADQLIAAGMKPDARVHLVLGDRTVTSHRLPDLLPVYRDRRARLETMLDTHQGGHAAVVWGDTRYRACGRCEVCAPEVAQVRDVLLVADMRATQRTRLRAAGIATIDELAASTGPVEGIGSGTLANLRAQARLQVEQSFGDAPRFELFAPAVVAKLPAPDPGDIFFDFEGDPLWAEHGSTDWGLEYLFGVVEGPDRPGGKPVFRPFWAHNRAQEKQALLDFLSYVTARRAQYPDLHVYHYASYEKTALLRLTGRHGVGEDAIDELLRAGVLVDLYATVRGSLRVGQDSYSLKKLEPLYMPGHREGEVTTAGDSIVEYTEACAARDAGDMPEWEERLARIADYNRYDCVSTQRLRDWLLARAAETAVSVAPLEVPGASESPLDPAPEQDPVVLGLLERAGEGPAADRSPEEQALAMVAASVGYHWREDKPFWWAHFDLLLHEPSGWTDRRGTLVVETVEVVQDWSRPPRARNPRRRLRLVGRLDPGSDLKPRGTAFALYDEPIPDCAKTSTNGIRGWLQNVDIVEVTAGAGGSAELDVLVVDEKLPTDGCSHEVLPMALAPDQGPPTPAIKAAIREFAEKLLGTVGAPGRLELSEDPMLDLLRRIPPRTRSRAPLPEPAEGTTAYIDAVTDALLDLDDSYLAVQGPPGTGKTYTGSRVIARLVDRKWRVGVVAQSHAVVEHMLTSVGQAGVPVEHIGKKPPQGDSGRDRPWQVLSAKDAFGRFFSQQTGGYVIGGTKWDFTTPSKLPPERYDLLVIDEAAQFSLADTVAVSRSARNLLLLGDPQQLPQVSQGRHPEPVDRSALGWLADGHETLPPELGYFLAHTWRMHPALCAAVSHLAYDDRLASVPATAQRSLDGVEPGVRIVSVEHIGNAVASVEEVDEVVRQVRAVAGRRWRDPRTDTGLGAVDRPLEPSDIVVVAAYNAQVWTIERALHAAGLTGVRVGTVDRFQGQEAPVVIVSMSASSAEDVPRGMEFLLSRNRINVAVSRGMWCAVVLRSPQLTDYLPTRPEWLEELGAFLGLASGSR